MDFTTRYLGLSLKSPLVAGASPITHDLDVARRLEDAGAGALVMHSLFEEQITANERAMDHHLSVHAFAHPEAQGYFPATMDFHLAPDAYLAQIQRLKEAVDLPIIASLNGISEGGWTRYATLMEQAGADALELNVYYLAMDPRESSEEVEQHYLKVLAAVKQSVKIPVAVKLSPFFSAPLRMAQRLEQGGADGLVLFNRFYQPDLDLENYDVRPALTLSSSATLLLRLRWLAAIFGHVKVGLAATGGVHSGRDALKALMSGACAVQLTSAILRHGPAELAKIKADMLAWMHEREYESVGQMVGSMSLERCPDPAAYERVNYMKVLSSWSAR